MHKSLHRKLRAFLTSKGYGKFFDRVRDGGGGVWLRQTLSPKERIALLREFYQKEYPSLVSAFDKEVKHLLNNNLLVK